MTRAKSMQMHAAKARKRLDGPSPDFLPALDYSAPVEAWTFRDYRRGRIHKLVLFHSRRRRGSFRVVVNDRLIRKTGKALAQQLHV